MKFLVRPCGPEDRDAVLDLAERLTIGVAAWRPHDAVLDAVRLWLDASTSQAGDGEAFVACARDEPRTVVGFVSVSSTRHFAGEHDANIGELVVHESVEGQRVGMRLIATAEHWAVDHGYRCITLTTGAANERALGFYHRLGYIDEDVKLTKLLPRK
jgi:ribosomal protein S18 acetylase RimI-like enzyme